MSEKKSLISKFVDLTINKAHNSGTFEPIVSTLSSPTTKYVHVWLYIQCVHIRLYRSAHGNCEQSPCVKPLCISTLDVDCGQKFIQFWLWYTVLFWIVENNNFLSCTSLAARIRWHHHRNKRRRNQSIYWFSSMVWFLRYWSKYWRSSVGVAAEF